MTFGDGVIAITEAEYRRLETEVERLRGLLAMEDPAYDPALDAEIAAGVEKGMARFRARVDLQEENGRLRAEVERLRELDESVKRAYKLVLDREGAVQVEPIDELVKARLDLLKEMEAHHQEHHARDHEAEARYKVVVNGAVNLVGLACDKHRADAATFGTVEFVQKYPPGCHWCVSAERDALRAERDEYKAAVIAALRAKAGGLP